MRLINFGKIDSRNSKKLSWLKGMFLTFFLVLGIISNDSFGQVSLTFSNGYLGTQNSAVQSTNAIKNFATLGIARVSFGQSYPGLNTFGGTQGNDLAGVIKLYLTSGRIISLNGALNWRETVTGDVVVYGLIIDEGQIATITYGASQTYTINGGSTSGTSTSIGLRSYLSTLTFTDGESRNGNAATSGIIANMNAELLSSPQPSSITLTNSNIIESQNLVYTVTLNTATTAGRPQVYTFNTSGTAIKGADFNATYTLSNGVLDNGDGTITVPGGVSSFSITVATIDDVNVESIENVLVSVGSKTGLGSIVDNDAPTAPNCDVNNPYDKIVSGYHQSIALKTDASFAVWGEDLDNSGAGEVLTPKDINVTNYPNLVGTPLKATIGGNGNTGNEQAVLLTTDGLYVWGSVGYVINYELKGSTGFGKINTNNFTASNVNTATGLPLGVNPYDVKMMTATYATLVLLTNAGDVWILSQNAGALNATGSTGVYPKTWFKAKIDATTFLTRITAIRVQTSTSSLNAIIALKSDGTVYTWGSSTYLGDGSASTQRTYATKMTLPGEFSITNIPKMIAVTGGIKNSTSVKNSYYILSNSGALYSLGYNAQKQLGDFTTTERTSWVNAKMNATTNFSNVSFITAQEHDASFPGVAIVTKTGDLYTWGQNEGLALGRNTEAANYDPGMPLGFTSGTDIALSAELGGHTLVYLKQGTTQFCYVGHKTSGSMGDGVSASSFINTFNCTGTPSMNICGSVPVAASTATSTITASPTTILANGSTTSIVTVQLKQSNGTNLTSTGGTVVISTNKGTVSDVTDNNNGTYTAILTSSTFVETATLNYTLNGSSGVNSATVNFIALTNPVITTTGSLKTFTTCSGCTVSPQTFSVSGVDLSTNNIVITAPSGVQVSTNANTDFATSINIVPTAGTVTTTTVFAKLTNNATSAASGVISVTSTGATSKTITVTTNTDNALNFDGSKVYGSYNYVSLNSSIASAYNNNSVTIEAWIKTTADKGINEIIAWGSSTATNNVVEFRTSGGKLQFILNNGSGKFYGLESTIFVNTGKWVHVAVVKSGTNIVLYVNGQVASGAASAGSDATSSPSLNNANIGVLGYNTGSSYNLITGSNFSGGIDQVRVWNTVKTSSDILSNMFVEMPSDKTGLVANYDFNQGIANGSNSITTLNDNSTNAFNGTLTNFPTTMSGSVSNFVAGFIPSITAAGNTTILSSGNTLQLSNGLVGGAWSSSNTSFATVNSTTGLVTGVAVGSATITYTVCDKTISYALTIVTPTITTSGTLKQFTSCSGCSIDPQIFTVSGTNLGADVTLTAPTGFELSTSGVGTYSTTLTLSQTGGTLTTTSVFAKLSNSPTTAISGNIVIASTGAISKTFTATVNTDNALSFDGVDDFVNIPYNSALDLLTAYTIEAWVKPSRNTGAQVIIGKIQDVNTGQSADLAYALRYNDGVLRAEIGNGTTSQAITSNNLVTNKWQHIAMVFNGSTSGSLILYIDGVQQGITLSTGYSSLKNVTSSLKFGSYGTFFSQYYKGLLDNVKIWNVTKTQSEITSGMHTELNGDETGLVAYYNFNQGIAGGTNTTITSLEGRTTTPHNGTLTYFTKTGSTSNFVAGVIPEIAGESILNKGLTTTYTNGLTGGTWSSAATNIATVNATTGAVTGVNPGTSTITYTICEKTISKLVTIVVPAITTSGTLTIFNTCLGTASAAQTFTVSAQYLTANLVLTAPAGYELATSSGGTYSSTLSIAPSSGSVSARLIYVRLSTSAVNGQSGNIVITSTDVVTRTIATGIASVTRTVAASVTISSNATNNTICSGTSITFTASATNGGISPTYQWYNASGAISGAISATYSTTSLVNNDVISVQMGSSLTSCVTGSPATSNSITTTVTAIPATPASISGAAIICMNSNQVYNITAVPGATSYSWVVTGDIIATPTTTNVLNITASNNAGSGTIKVLANNTCGSSIYSNVFSVTISSDPAPTASYTVSGNTVCLTSAGVTFTSTSTPNATTSSTITTYAWTFGDGTTAATSTASNTYTGSGSFDAILTITDAAACTSSISSRITVDPISVAGTATALNTIICEGSNTTLNLTGNTGTIQWQSSTDGSSFTNITGATSASYNTGSLTTTTYYQAVVTSGVCSAATSGVVTVTVSSTPTFTLGAVANVNSNATNFELIYTNAIGSPNEFSIVATLPNALPGFTAINSYGLLASPLTISIPASVIGTYNFNLTLVNANLGCTSATIPFTLNIMPEAPANLSYTTPNVYTVGTTITALNPTSTGGPIASYIIAPSLPAGLTLNTITGIISGTPTATSVQTSYTVTGTNAAGTVTATVVITVNIAAPAGLSYTTPNVYTVGTTITALNPTSTGGPIASYSIAPSLPAGLTLNTSTGIISGTPTATSVQTSYTVTGTNAAGTVTATVVITVNIVPPASLSYTTPNVYTVGTTITSLNPTSTGGPIASYSIAPSLPLGLTLNTSTGIISGTPTATSVQTSYTVTGTNAAGTVTATVVITVNEAAPLSLSYITPNVDTVGVVSQTLNPTSTGGPIATYSIAPSLPAGLTLNTSTGIISGTPTAKSVQTSYTVTGTNVSGTVTATVVITVKEAAPLSLSYTTPNVYTVGTTITSLNPTSTGGPIVTYTISPSLPLGLILNTSTGIISGTPTATSLQTSYTVTGTNTSGTVTANVIITVVSGQPLLPQGGINAVDYKLLAPDTVKIKLNIQAGASPFNVIIGNNNNNLKDTISNVVDGDIIKLSPINNTTIYSFIKLTDNNGVSRTSGFNKDTTMITILAPNIALTLKADKATKLPDNSFKTKLLLKIKNSGEIDLKNVQVNANLSEVFPIGVNYTLDSVRVLSGNVTLNNGYKGNGTAKKPNSVNKGIGASSGIKTYAILDANYLFSNGVNMAINEESEISFYISIAPTSDNVVLKLQFTSAGEGLLTKSDGSTSQQSSIAASDDGINIALHPNNTNLGIPAPTYLPLVPIASIGAALSASGPTIVTNGYTFDFVAKLENFSNINLDTIAIINDFSKTFTSPDTAYIINTPVVTGGITYNTNFNGYSNTLLIDSAVKLVVGDSVTIAYTLFVKTTKTTGSWSSSILGSGHSTIDYIYVSDVSKDGINPDPNGDKDPLEQGSTSFYVNYTPPAPPTVENKAYVFGTTMPLTIAPLVKSYPSGSVPVWCNVATTLCTSIAPATPTLIGKYVYQLRSYDTTTKLYSIAYVNDTVIIKPPVPMVKDSAYIIGLNTNPANIGVQVSGMQGSLLNYFLLASRQTAVPVLGTTVSVKRYTVSQTVNEIESDTVGFNVAMLNQNDMVHLQKLAEEPILQSNSTFNITYKFIVNNLSADALTNVLITDNLQNTIPLTAEYTIVSISATGGLVANTSFNGSTNTYLTNASSKVNAFAKDTIVFTLNIKPKGFSGVMNNTATIAATSRYGVISMVSSAATKISETSKSPTPVIIPDVIIDIPEVFSPNRDGVNDRFVIIKPFGTTLNLEIFNRWGNIVYANPNYNNEWDGRGTNNFIGQDLLDGGYYYNLKAINKNGETKIFKGFVIIQR